MRRLRGRCRIGHAEHRRREAEDDELGLEEKPLPRHERHELGHRRALAARIDHAPMVGGRPLTEQLLELFRVRVFGGETGAERRRVPHTENPPLVGRTGGGKLDVAELIRVEPDRMSARDLFREQVAARLRKEHAHRHLAEEQQRDEHHEVAHRGAPDPRQQARGALMPARVLEAKRRRRAARTGNR